MSNQANPTLLTNTYGQNPPRGAARSKGSIKLDRDTWRRVLHRLAICLGVVVTLVVGVIITFAWIAILVRGFAAFIPWAIRSFL
jgi:hypothetical protein